MESLRHDTANKQARIMQLDQQKKNFNIEVSGLEIAQEALKAKLKKRKAQLHESELEVKTIREKLNEIQKRVTPEVIKNLNK
jgi:peptidoglycan hydrolase CwlO-like protein